MLATALLPSLSLATRFRGSLALATALLPSFALATRFRGSLATGGRRAELGFAIGGRRSVPHSILVERAGAVACGWAICGARPAVFDSGGHCLVLLMSLITSNQEGTGSNVSFGP